MASNVFISFRFQDGHIYKEQLARMLVQNRYTVDCSESQDRSAMSEYTIRNYLYRKLQRSSVTIVLLTPGAVNHQRNWLGQYDDWMYDEIRYSLENRDNNRTNGLIAVYTPEAEPLVINKWAPFNSIEIRKFDNLCRVNMQNVKPEYKKNESLVLYDNDWDSYCSMLSWSEFTRHIGKYVNIAAEKRNEIDKYVIQIRML